MRTVSFREGNILGPCFGACLNPVTVPRQVPIYTYIYIHVYPFFLGGGSKTHSPSGKGKWWFLGERQNPLQI